MLRRACPVLVLLLSLGLLYGQASTQKQLSIEAIFAPGSITGRAPEALHWTPDQKSFSYIQRDDSGEHAQLWLVNAATGEKKVLVSDDKLAKLAPPIESIKDDRQKDQAIFLVNRPVIVPPKSIIDCQSRVDPPGIRRISRELVLPVIPVLRGHLETGGLASSVKRL